MAVIAGLTQLYRLGGGAVERYLVEPEPVYKCQFAAGLAILPHVHSIKKANPQLRQHY